MLWWTKVDVERVTDKNFVCQLQFPSDAGTSRENGWVEEGWGLEPAGPWMRVKYYESTFRYVSRLGEQSEQIGGQGRNKLEASRPDKEQAKGAWPTTWDERHDELPGRHKARGNGQNGKCGSGSLEGDLRG